MALPPEIAGHLNLDGPPVTPRPAATVLLVRDGDPWELLMVRRPGGADFAPGAYVFPGGAVHDEDRADIFNGLGIIEVICPSLDGARRLAQSIAEKTNQ